MNTFALNGAALNGSTEVWIGDTLAQIALQGDGSVSLGLVGAGQADVALVAGLEPSALVKLAGDAQVAFSAAGDSLLGVSAEGEAGIALNAGGDGTRWVFGVGLSDVEWYAEGDGVVVEQVSARFNIVVMAELDASVSVIRPGEGVAPIVFDASLLDHAARVGNIEGRASIHLGAEGVGYGIIQSPAGYSEVQFSAAGDIRLGERVHGRGDALLDVFAAGDIGAIHYVWGEGLAAVELSAMSAQAGIPSVPLDYVPAPRGRVFIVQRDARTYRVPQQIRSL